MPRFNEPAALHFGKGAIADQDVPPGIHDVSGIRMTLTFPEGASVARSPGATGDGYDLVAGAANLPRLTLAATLLAIKRSGAKIPWAMWAEAIKEAAELHLDAADLEPLEAKLALDQLGADSKPAQPARRKTPAKRIGADMVAIELERLTKAKRKATVEFGRIASK